MSCEVGGAGGHTSDLKQKQEGKHNILTIIYHIGYIISAQIL